MSRYRIEVEEVDGWSRWVQPVRRGYKMACCDCGLVHEMDFSYVRNGRGVFIVFRARRHTRATAAKRRHMKAKK